MVDGTTANAILGKSVRGSAGEDMGRIVDVIVGNDGAVRAAVIDFGGFLGVGSRKVAVDWKALGFMGEGKPGLLTLALTRAQVRQSPEYRPGESFVILGVGSVAPASVPTPPIVEAAVPPPAPASAPSTPAPPPQASLPPAPAADPAGSAPAQPVPGQQVPPVR